MKTILLLTLFLISSCGKIPKLRSSQEKQDVSPLFSKGELQVQVYYEPGAEPYTDKMQGLELWNLLKLNLEALFEGRAVTVSVPVALEQMTKTDDFNKASWTIEDVMKMASEYPLSEEKGTTKFQIFFVEGLADGNPGIIGYHISNTRIMAIFKDVIRASGTTSNETVSKYVEQATLIHEMGHALGLVNNGIPMVKDHHDSAHGAHCSNPNCVMYYSNEGAANMLKFAGNAAQKGSIIMFDQACLDDSRNYQK